MVAAAVRLAAGLVVLAATVTGFEVVAFQVAVGVVMEAASAAVALLVDLEAGLVVVGRELVPPRSLLWESGSRYT